MPLHPNAILAAKRLQQAGYSKAQIAGILGNLELESGFNPRINEGGAIGAPARRGGYGLAQWTGSRQDDLINYAKKRNINPGDPNIQVDFLLHELQGPEKGASDYILKAASPEEAARRFVTDFERAGTPKTAQRQQAARSIYQNLGFLDPAAPAPAPTSTPTRRSVEDILGSALGLTIKPGLESTQNKTQNVLSDTLSNLVKGAFAPTVPSFLNPFGSMGVR